MRNKKNLITKTGQCQKNEKEPISFFSIFALRLVATAISGQSLPFISWFNQSGSNLQDSLYWLNSCIKNVKCIHYFGTEDVLLCANYLFKFDALVE